MVRYCLEKGHRVATFSRSEPSYLKEVNKVYPDKLIWEALDATDVRALKAFCMKVFKQTGSIDGLINNAGANLDALIPTTTDADIDHILLLIKRQSYS